MVNQIIFSVIFAINVIKHLPSKQIKSALITLLENKPINRLPLSDIVLSSPIVTPKPRAIACITAGV